MLQTTLQKLCYLLLLSTETKKLDIESPIDKLLELNKIKNQTF